ncbi:hypothetical protein F4801DRAFT_559184 [Xylaria longipes]|nr:hypothetical protein F4801DRAFT_559184 [Xylaria longipes]
MAFGGDIEMDEVMADDELLPFTDSDSETYSSEEEGVGSVPQKESLGFIPDEDVDLVSNKENMGFVSSEGENEEEHTTIRPKIPFKGRLDPFVRPKDEKWQKIENYFFSLLRTPNVSINDILEGTFDDHEITLITPQSGPPDLVEWQRRNAHRYHEGLETRFKGATDTLAFKLTCLYFGFQVEPLRMGTMPFLLPPDPEPLDAKNALLKADPLGFLNKYNNEEKSIYDKNILSLRGGGASGFGVNKAIQEIPAKGYKMDIDWWDGPAAKELAKKASWSSVPTSKKAKKEAKKKEATNPMNPPNSNTKTEKLNTPPNNPVLPAVQLRIYGWQGAMNTSLNYLDFVTNVDRLISNSAAVDRSICVEIWRTSPEQFVQNAFGMLRHGVYNPPASDRVWKLVQRYFGQGDDHSYACFIRTGDEGDAIDTKRPGGYQPPSTERGVVAISHSLTKDVAYMRVPQKLRPEHKPHQFSFEYMLAMQVLFASPPHAWVLYQAGYIGAAYQYLDPPGGLWDQVIDAQSEWSSLPIISFTLNSLESTVVPVIVPGVFTSRKLPELDRKDFKLTKSTQDSTGLSKMYKAVELSLKNVNLKSECTGFEIWCPGTDFKYITQQPTHVAFSGNITNPKSLQDWQGLLGSEVVPDQGSALVVRPVYKTYRLRKCDDDKYKVDLQLNEYNIDHFKSVVRNRIYRHYNATNPSQVLILSAINQESFQTELTIQHNTTEQQWQWIRRNIVEPELIVSIEDLGNEWSIPKNSRWGPRYAAINNSGSIPTEQGKSATKPSHKTEGPTGQHPPAPDGSSNETGQTPHTNQGLFGDKNDPNDEATRMQILRDRTFTSVNSIFTNPLKPVMPLHGPPLESIIRTGPSMPGVSIAMMTPTEVLRLQREVHSLRFQLLDRTRECPYADCDRYFTFADPDGLDKHVREDHSVLRCFLCDKNQHLFPYYNADQIKEHFASEHLDDVLKAHGQAEPQEPVIPERLCDFFFVCGVVTTQMNQEQLDEHMKTHEDTRESSDEDGDEPEPDSLPDPTNPKPIEQDTNLDLSDPEHKPPSPPDSVHEDENNLFPEFVPSATSSSSDSDRSLSPIVISSHPVKKLEVKTPAIGSSVEKTPRKIMFSSEAWGPDPAEKKNKKKKTVKHQVTGPSTPAPETTSPKIRFSSEAWGPDPAKKKTVKPTKSLEQPVILAPTTTKLTKSPDVQQKHPVKSPKSAKRVMVPVVDPKTEPNFNIFTAYNPNLATNTDQDTSQWIRDAVERHIADGGKKHVPVNATRSAALRKQQLDEYVALGGKLPSDEWPAGVSSGSKAKTAKASGISKNIASTPGAEALLAALAAQVVGGNTTEEEDEEDAGGEKKKRKRKRHTDAGSGSEAYEYSERSAVSDPLANLAADAPPSPKKQRGGSGKSAKTPVITRTGRAVRPSRAAREAAEASSSSSSSSSSDSPSSSSSDSSKSSGSDESSEFEYEAENIERRLRERN